MQRPLLYAALLAIIPSVISSPLQPNPVIVRELSDDPPTTTTTSAPIPTKTISDCNVEGIATAALSARAYGSWIAPNVTQCQYSCRWVTQCISYSWEPSVSNCTVYNSWSYITPDNTTGVFYSDKYPSDGSDFCYGTSAYEA